MLAKFWQTIIRVWFFLSYLITTVKVTVHAHDRNRNVPTELQKLFRPNVQTRKKNSGGNKTAATLYQTCALAKRKGKPGTWTISYVYFNMVYLFVKVIVQCRVNIGRQAITTSSLSEAVEASGLGHNTSIDATVEAAMAFWHSIYIRTVSS